ncbi:hypothetical protein SKAU_G00222500 [Synaphobranchus kaupii]|uniref:Uncharacterized protein n=1 Tax=Synaphobranchus kaupii TaxID=118154 RepID=A0A9Q1FB22_SYNKA|nr:hypothetical protein SKAU_G00222500 [Synaphobranchus kaupii]
MFDRHCEVYSVKVEWELELMIQQYEEENEEEKPRMWTRLSHWPLYFICTAGALILGHFQSSVSNMLSVYTAGFCTEANQVKHTECMEWELELMIQQYEEENEEEKPRMWTRVGQTQLVEAVIQLPQQLLAFSVARGHQLVALKDTIISQSLSSRARLGLAVFLNDLHELGKILLQLLINTTPLYTMQLEDCLNQDDLSETSSFITNPLKQDGLPAAPPEIHTLAVPSTSTIHRRSSATEALLAPIKQLVSQGQRALAYLSPAPHQENTRPPVVGTSEH